MLLLMASCKKECTSGVAEITVRKDQQFLIVTNHDGKEYEPGYYVTSKNNLVTTHSLPYGDYEFMFIGSNGEAYGLLPATINQCNERLF